MVLQSRDISWQVREVTVGEDLGRYISDCCVNTGKRLEPSKETSGRWKRQRKGFLALTLFLVQEDHEL
jgi:hypothetical protein